MSSSSSDSRDTTTKLWLGSLVCIILVNWYFVEEHLFTGLYDIEFSHPAILFLGTLGILSALYLYWKQWARLGFLLACGIPILITSIAVGYLMTSGVGDYNYVNTYATQAEYVERYTTTSTDSDGNTTTTSWGPYWHVFSKPGTQIDISEQDWKNYGTLWCPTKGSITSRLNPSADDFSRIYSCNFDGDHFVPVAEKHTVLNFIKGSQYSILKKKYLGGYKDLLRPYPQLQDTGFGAISLPRVVVSGSPVSEESVTAIKNRLDTALMELGAKRQVNIVLNIVGSSDPNFRYAIEGYWEGGKKNDLIVTIGSPDGTTIAWVDAFAMTDNTLFLQELKDDVMQLGHIDGKLADVILAQVDAPGQEGYIRLPMANFKELGSSVLLPWWGFIVVILLAGIWIIPTILMLEE